MNRSYSKIRHIQESNLILEKRILSEQSDAAFDRRYGTADAAAKTNAENRAMVNSVVNWYKNNNHTINVVLGIGATFIPFVGPFIASGIGMMDAKQYWDEGHRTEAGVVAAFSLLPGIGMIVNKIPGVKELGAKGMSALAGKLASKAPLTQLEQGVVTGIGENSALVTQALDDTIKGIAAQGVNKTTNEVVKSELKRIAHKGIHAGIEKSVEHATSDILTGKGGKYIPEIPGALKNVRNIASRAVR